jgi:hypothetical protein
MESVGGKLSQIVNCERFEESLFLNWRSRLSCFVRIGRCLRSLSGIQGQKPGILVDSAMRFIRMQEEIVAA